MKGPRAVFIGILTLLTLPAAARRGDPPAIDPGGIQRLLDDSGRQAVVRVHRATGAARFVRLTPGSLPLSGATPIERASDFFRRHGNVFGIADDSNELSAPEPRDDWYGNTHLEYRQIYRGLPVFAGMLRVHFDPAGRLTAVNGTFIPGIRVDSRPSQDPDTLAETAVARVRRQHPMSESVHSRGHRLLVFRTGLLERVPGSPRLAFEFEIGNGADVREFIYLDAHTGKLLDQITGVHDAVDRKIHEPDFNDVVIWMEGDALPYATGNAANDDQVNGLIHTASDVYDLFANLSGGGFLSWDGLDGTMHSIWNASFVNCPNATWNGTSTNYCDGVASDDVVAHEWGHGYTESTHGLIYQWQPGALNESYSDIFGEVVDFTNGAGTDTPGAVRSSDGCSTFGGSPPPTCVVNSPAAIAGPYLAGGANFNPTPPLAATADVELVDDGDDEGGSASVTDACQSLVGFTPGNIALIDRGDCGFSGKVLRAQNAGAVGVIMVNSGDGVFSMGGSNSSITIPSVMVGHADGDLIKAQLGNGLNATIAIEDSTDGSLRWLMGEDSFAFGGPIRDLWNPVCLGDPGKVSDAQYVCGTGDSGGVHTNSGVPNHAFALLVDGGTFNGRTIAALGLTKATHLYWRAMSVYQVEDSGFDDHADALGQSCSDLLGVDLVDLTTGAPSGEVVGAADCDAVTEALLAVEMADAPPCNFSPLLDPNTPPLECGTLAFSDDFESDPAETWSLSNVGVFDEYTPRDWEWTASVPPGGSGSAFFAVDDIDLGNCIEGDDDQSGMMSLDSPAIVLPSGGATLSFDHYVATEPGFDGGNLRISVNGGAFQPISSGDFIFNPYNDVLEDAPDNTNPMAGQEAFTGTDGGEVSGSWGQSQVDLGAYAGAGDTIRIGFDFGVDGCNGLDGWYVDNVAVCTSATATAAGRVPDGADVPGVPLTVARASGGEVTLSWSGSCLAGDDDYEIYKGTIGEFTSHAPEFCSTAGATAKTFPPGLESSYFLVVPRNTSREGSYGTDSNGDERQQSAEACLDQIIAVDCP